MKITWIGHSCFLIESDGYRLIIDPYEDGYVPGLKPLREKADVVLSTHDHGDHGAVSLVEISGRTPTPFKVTSIESFHDDKKGALRGQNTMYIIEDGKYRICHLGDIGCELEQSQKDKLKGADVLLIPVGGHFTITPGQAADLTKELSPRIAVPMHFRDSRRGFGFDVISEVSEYVNLAGDATVLEKDTIDPEENFDTQVVVLVPRDV